MAARGELYSAIIRSIRESDSQEGTLFLKRLLGASYGNAPVAREPDEGGPEWWVHETRRKIQVELPKLDDPETMPDWLVKHMLPQVGITKSVGFLSRGRTPRDLRRLLLLAVPMWKEKGTPRGIVGSVRALTGRDATYHDWFEQRSVLGESLVGEEGYGLDLGCLGGMDTLMDECVSLLKLMDDGTLDEDLLLRLVELHRPINETIEVVVLDFYDNFSGESSRIRWDTLGGTSPGVFDSGVFKLPAGSVEKPIVSVAPESAFTSLGLAMRFSFDEPGDGFRVHFLTEDDGNYLYVEVRADGASAQWNLGVVQAGLLTDILYNDVPFPIYAGVNHTLRIDVCPAASGSKQVTLAIDAEQLVSTEIVGGAAAGHIRLEMDDANAGNVNVDNVEISRLPYRYAVVAPSGITKSSNFSQ